MAKKKSTKKSDNIFDKKYAFIQLINGDNLIAQLIGVKEIEDKNNEGEVVSKYKIYRIRSPYKIFEVYDRGVMKSTLIVWNPYIECDNEFILSDDSIMFMDRHLKPDIILRYWQTMYLSQDEYLEYSINKIEKDYIEFLERDPEANEKLLKSYERSKDFTQTLEDTVRNYKYSRDKEDDDEIDEMYEEEETEDIAPQPKPKRRKSKQRRSSRKNNARFDDMIRSKIVDFFGNRNWIFNDPDILEGS